jgi:L-arabinokinase
LSQQILYAITGHGYGHATRSLAIAGEIRKRHPDLAITYSTAVPQSFLERSGAGPLALVDIVPAGGGTAHAGPRVGSGGRYRFQDYEPGTMDGSYLAVDPEATRAAYRRFFSERERRISLEAENLKAGRYCGVISDVAAVPIAAAGRAGIPAVAVSNFTWDWILSPYLEERGDRRILDAIREDYRPAEVYLRLPFHPPEHPFRAVEDVPLVGRRATLSRDEVRRRLGLSAHTQRPLALVTIGGFSAEGWPAVRVPGFSGLDFLVVGRIPLEFSDAGALAIPDDLGKVVGFTDLVAAADLVISKPGYGICSECAAAGTPILCVERAGFRESPVLRDSVGKIVPCREIPLSEFLAGRWEPFVTDLLSAPRPPPSPTPGAAVAAERIGEILALGK